MNDKYKRSVTPTLVTGAAPSVLGFGDAFTRQVQGERDDALRRLADVTAAYESTQKDLDAALQRLEDYSMSLEHASDRRQREQSARLAAEKRAADAEARAESAERELSAMALKTARELLVEVHALLAALRAGSPVPAPCDMCLAERAGWTVREPHTCGRGLVGSIL